MSAVLRAVVAALASALLTWLAIAWARAARMHDEPGARRMHVEPTVRGAGIGFVAVIVSGWGAWGIALGWAVPLGRWAIGASLALVLVALVSWIDDRRGLPVLPRLVTHIMAAMLLAFASWPTLAAELPWPLALCLPLLAVPAINFWNFIDGINGMAASQAVLVAAALAVLALMAGDTPAAWFAALAAGAVLGFLPSNFPSARAFMGDVGSASLGLIVIALGPYRANGFYSRILYRYHELLPVLGDAYPHVHVLTNYADGNRHNPEWLMGEIVAKKRGADVTILHDADGETTRALRVARSPHVFILDREGIVRYDGFMPDEGGFWQGLA